MLHPFFQPFPLCCPLNRPSVGLIDDGTFSSFYGRSFNASSFFTFLLQVTSAVMSLAFCLHVLSQAPQHHRIFFFFFNCIVPLVFLPCWKFGLLSPRKVSWDRVTLSSLQFILDVLLFPYSTKLLTWTTGSLTCGQM